LAHTQLFTINFKPMIIDSIQVNLMAIFRLNLENITKVEQAALFLPQLSPPKNQIFNIQSRVNNLNLPHIPPINTIWNSQVCSNTKNDALYIAVIIRISI